MNTPSSLPVQFNTPTQTKMPCVLCIDDDPDVTRALELRLSDYEVRVIHAYTGMQGYWQAVCQHTDVIIADMQMPQGDGACLLKSLKKNPTTAAIPVIVLSGLRNPDLRGRVRNLGAEVLLTKPIQGAEIVEQISRFVPLQLREVDKRKSSQLPV